MRKIKDTLNRISYGMGIRSRLMTYLVIFVAFIIGFLWLFQIVLLNDFYRIFKIRQIEYAAEAISGNINNEDVDALADQLSSENEVCILLLDDACNITVSSEGHQMCLIHRIRASALKDICENTPEDGSAVMSSFTFNPPREKRYDNEHFIGNVPEGRENTDTISLMYTRRLTKEDGSTCYLLVNDIVTPVTATVDALRTQMVFITLIILLGAVALSFILSHRFSSPIIETNTAARQLAHSQYTPPPHAKAYREIKELNDTLSAAAGELSQVEHLQHELIANISHDLRTPLTMIGGYAELMRDIPSESTPENMQIIIDETRRLSTMVNELLDFSKMQAGINEMNIQPFNLTEAIRSMADRCTAMTEKDGYHIVFAPQLDVRVNADENRIGRVLYNLLNNALTYTGEDKTVRVLQLDRGQKVRIEVRDSGKGIAEEELPFVWNRYWRSGESHKRALQGSGLGLNIVRTILEAHHAEYGVESREGEGTCFWFELDQASS